MTIEPMQIEDLPEILKLENELYIKPWEEKDYLYELNENPYAYYFKLVYEKQIIGYLGFWITFDVAQITKVSIAKAYQNKRLSYILMEDLEQRIKKARCHKISLEVRVSNQRAIHVYEKSGFYIASIRKHYYSDFEDAYLMIKEV